MEIGTSLFWFESVKNVICFFPHLFWVKTIIMNSGSPKIFHTSHIKESKSVLCFIFESFMKFVYKESLSTTTISNKSTPGKAEWKNIALNFPILWWPLICRQESERKYNMWPHYFWPSFLSMSHWRLICMCLYCIPFKFIFW